MSEPRLVIASGNAKKRREIEDLLAGTPCRVLTLKDFPACPDVLETGATFAENAALKAVSVAEFTGLLTLADDSGLEVDALGGQPGIHSARFASGNRNSNASDEANIRLLLARLGGVPLEKRSARFVCAMALAGAGIDGKATLLAETAGTVEGSIIGQPRGTHGFGYDPVFLLPGSGKTFAELGPEVKSQISHRARALQRMLPEIRNYLAPEGFAGAAYKTR